MSSAARADSGPLRPRAPFSIEGPKHPEYFLRRFPTDSFQAYGVAYALEDNEKQGFYLAIAKKVAELFRNFISKIPHFEKSITGEQLEGLCKRLEDYISSQLSSGRDVDLIIKEHAR